MLARANFVLLIVFSALLVFYMTDRDRYAGLGASPTISLELFPEFDRIAADRVVINDRGRSVEMRRDGESWLMASSGDHPVGTEKVDRLLEKLETLQKGTVASRNTDSFERLGVDGGNREVFVYGESEDPLIHFYIGHRGGGNRRTFIRKDGAEETLAVLDQDLGKIFTSSAFSWFENLDILKFDAKLAIGLTVQSRSSQAVFARDEKGDWAQTEPLGLEADQVRVVRVVRALAQLQFTDVATPDPDKDFGFGDPTVRAQIRLSDDTSYSITAGATSDDGGFRYVKKEGDEKIYMVPVRSFDSTFIASAAEWLAAPVDGASQLADRKFTGPAMGADMIRALMGADAVVDATAVAEAVQEDGSLANPPTEGEEWIEVPFLVSGVLKGEENVPVAALDGATPLRVQLPVGRQLPNLAPSSGAHMLFLKKTEEGDTMRLAGDPIDSLIQPTAQTRASMGGILQQMKNMPKPPQRPDPSGSGG